MNDAELARAGSCARIVESLTNFGRAELDAPPPAPPAGGFMILEYEPGFWWNVLENPQPFGSPVIFPTPVILSEWVARVPGLFWTDTARALREQGHERVESRSGETITLKPFGKSEVVGGGVGTLKLPPSPDGYHLASVTATANASSGVPVLIAPEVWAHHRLSEGAVIEIRKATWQAMATSWAEQFPSTSRIPRAYAIVDDPNAVTVQDRGAAVQIHPFSIMQHHDGAAELYDFVYTTAYPSERDHRAEVEEFFERYRRAEGRYGQYLINADIARPIWESQFYSPAEVRRAEQQLRRRIEDAMLGANTTEHLLGVLSELTHGELQLISARFGIPHQRWFRGESVAREAGNFLEFVPRESTVSLIDAIRVIRPDVLPH